MAQGRFFDACVRQRTYSMVTGSTGAGSGPTGLGWANLGPSAARARLVTVVPDPSDTSIAEVPFANGYTSVSGYIDTATSNAVSTANAWAANGMTGGGSDPWTITNSGGGLRWPEATGSWGTIRAVVFCSNATAPAESNLVCYFELDTPVTIDATDIFQIDEGELSLSLGDFVTY